MFDDIAEKMYQLVVQKRQYKNYLNCLKLFTVPPCVPTFTASQVNQLVQNINQQPGGQVTQQTPVEVTTTAPPATGGEQVQATNVEAEKPAFYDIRLYNDLLDSIPPELIDTDLMLHCMVEQVINE